MKDEEKSSGASKPSFHPSRSRPYPSSRVAAILLAAGRSRRMGHFKPLLPFGDQTVAEACINYLRKGGVEAIVVVLGHRAVEMRERLSHLPVMFAHNAEAESEMGVSIARGVEALPPDAEAVFIALCDQPAIPAEVVSQIIEARQSSGARILVPEHSGRGGHPPLLDLSLRRELLSLSPARGLRALFDAHREALLRVPVVSPYVARDMDTWDDYRALYEEVFGVAPPEARPL